MCNLPLHDEINCRIPALGDLRGSLHSGLGDNLEVARLRIQVPNIVPGGPEEGAGRNRQSHRSRPVAHVGRPTKVDAVAFFRVAATACF